MNDQSTALAQLQNIHDIVEGRDKAVAAWMTSYQTYHQQREVSASACIGGNLSLIFDRGYNRGPSFESDMTEAFLKSGEGAEARFRTALERLIDRRCWSEMMDVLGFGELLDAKARAEWRESLDKDPPAFTAENCEATFGHIWANRGMFFQRGIAETFSKLDRRFRSHTGFKIGSRIIIDGAFGPGDWWWSRHDRRDTIRDVERALFELAGLPAPRPHDWTPSERRAFELRGEEAPDWQPPITDLIERRYKNKMVPCTVDTEFLHAKLFLNGNIHLWFRDKAVLEQLNKILAEYYGEVLGDARAHEDAAANPSYKMTMAKNFGEFFTSPELAERVIDRYVGGIRPGMTVLEPSAGKGALAGPAARAGAIVDCIEIQPGHAHELVLSRLFRRVERRNFLEVTPPVSEDRQYDLVLMNPPFDRGLDVDHCRHAWQFVKPGGRLVAIMSARAEFGDDARHKALHAIVEKAEGVYGRRDRKWHDLPERSFAHAGTNVNTVVLAIRKPH